MQMVTTHVKKKIKSMSMARSYHKKSEKSEAIEIYMALSF
jgi:hypothetical protein